MRPNYREILQRKREEKFEKLSENLIDEQECNYSDKDKCVACTHPNWCIFDKKRILLENEITILQNQRNDLKNYLKNGKETNGYDDQKIRVQILRLRKELKQRNEHLNRYKRKR